MTSCSRCNATNPADARFCGGCGAPLPVANAPCAGCGEAIAAGQRFCNRCGRARDATPAPRPGDEGERRQATVMFSDLTGYTAWNEVADPEEVEATMAEVKRIAAQTIERHGGTVNQFVGDEVMALFGVPIAGRDDARHAVAAALELHQAVAGCVDAGARRHSGPGLVMHTGINTGLVVVRRSDARAGAYTLTGDTVNTAARLRSLAGPGEIVVGGGTWQQVAACCVGDPAEALDVRGRGQPVLAHRILGLREAVDADAGPVLGRDEELREFTALAEACGQRGRGRLLLVRGDPGVGKSRLVAEFARHAAAAGWPCHTAAVLDFGTGSGRDAARSLARSLLGVAANAEEPERRQAVERAAVAALGSDLEVFVHDLADVPPPLALRALAAAMSPAARARGSVRALAEIVRRAGTASPVFLLVEDIHWADASTLEHLAELAALAGRQPILLVMTTRFAGDPSAGAWRSALHGAPLVGIDLSPLSTDAAAELAGAAAADLPADLVASCVARAEGNPLFLLQLLLDAAAPRAHAELPGSIQALVHSRMDRLAAADKLALQAAAVLGQRFALDPLRHVVDDPTCDVRGLIEQFLIRPDGAELLFCHALIRDGAYASLLHVRRRQLHVRAAAWFAPHDPVLAAEHLDRADDAGAPAAYLAASRAAAAQFRHPQALALAQRGLELAADPELRFELLLARARSMLELGQAAGAVDVCRAALALAVQPAQRVEALIASAAAMRLLDRIEEGLAALDEAQPLAQGHDLTLARARLHHLRGNLLFPLGRQAECLREHEAARLLARQAGSLEAEAAALGGLGDAYYLHGRMPSAHRQFTECVALARRHGFGRLEVANLPMVGWLSYHLLDARGAVAMGEEAVELAIRSMQPRAEVLARVLVAWVRILTLGDEVGVDDHLDAGLQRSRSIGSFRFEAQLRGLAALLALRRGDRVAAADWSGEALALCRSHAMSYIGPWVLGVCALVEPDPAARRGLLDEGELQLARGSVSHNHLQLRELAIECGLEMGDFDAVEATCRRLRAYSAAEPVPLSEFFAARGLALARAGRGDRSAALAAELGALHEQAVRIGAQTRIAALDSACRTLSPSGGAVDG